MHLTRVMWTVKWDGQLELYVKDPPVQDPYNFVWSPQVHWRRTSTSLRLTG